MTEGANEGESQTPRIVMWGLVFVLMLAFRGPSWLALFNLPDSVLNDFCQDWVSARYWMEGTPVYADQKPAAWRLLGRRPAPGYEDLQLTRNAHPPASILLALPLAALPYEQASRIWSLFWLATFPISFLLAVRALDLALPPWGVFPLGAALLWCNPLSEEIAYGQFNLPLLLLIVSGWACVRGGWPWLGGGLLGAAAAAKLFPAFLFLPFLVRRDWKVLGGGCHSVAALTAVSAAIFGVGAYVEYVSAVIPHVGTFRSSWLNLSLPGFLSRLFNPAMGPPSPCSIARGSMSPSSAARPSSSSRPASTRRRGPGPRPREIAPSPWPVAGCSCSARPPGRITFCFSSCLSSPCGVICHRRGGGGPCPGWRCSPFGSPHPCCIGS